MGVKDDLAMHPLARLMAPRGVALIGASESPSKYGFQILKTLLDGGYQGRVYPVNPRGGELQGVPFLRSLDEAGGPVDVALVVRPAAEAVAVVRSLAGRIPFVIVYAAGFAERGEEGAELERRLVDSVAGSGTRIIGPNGMNVFSAPARLNLSAISPFPRGRLGFVSASGNLAFALAHEAARSGRVGFSRFVSVGNQADLGFDDYLDYLRADPETAVVLVFVEGLGRRAGRAFLDALARTAAEKPVLVLRGGRTRVGSEVARSHTAALATDARVQREALEQAGAVLVDRADEALAVAEGFLESPLPRGRRVLLVGEGGGHATLLADAAVEAGLAVEPLPEGLLSEVAPHLPSFAAIRKNPIELAGKTEYDALAYGNVLQRVIGWEGCDQVVLFGGYALYDERLASFLAQKRGETGKPILIHDLYADDDRAAIARLRARGLPVYVSADVTVRVASALSRGARAKERARRALAAAGTESSPVSLPEELRATLDEARTREQRALTEDEATRLVAHFGVPVLPSRIARSPEEVVAAAEEIGFPVVLKAHGPRFVHKTEWSGVRLDLRTAGQVKEARASLAFSAEVRITPFRAGGVELIVGARRDAALGPIALVGAGGVLTEIAGDVAIRTLPCGAEELEEMVSQTIAGRWLGGRGGRARWQRGPVVEILESLARLITALPEVSEVEVNPLRCDESGVVALDARVLVAS